MNVLMFSVFPGWPKEHKAPVFVPMSPVRSRTPSLSSVFFF